MMISLQFTGPQRLNKEEGSREHAWLSLGRRNKLDFGKELWERRIGSRKDKVLGVNGESIGKNNWNWGVFGCVWKLSTVKISEIYEDDPSEDSSDGEYRL